MAYVKRHERRADIIAAVINVASTEGFAAATIRRIAADLNMAIGGIHHIFSSSAEMKREAFRTFVKQSFGAMGSMSTGSTVDRLVPFLCPPDEPAEAPRIFMWREALNEATRDSDFAEVYCEAMASWHQQLSDIIIESLDTQIERQHVDDMVWRLKALSSGFTGFSRVSGLPLTARRIEDHVRHIVAMELAQLQRVPA